MGRTLALLVALPCACGRMSFDQHDASAIATVDAPVDLALVCGQERFQVGLSLSGMTAAATQDGVAMFAVDTAGELRGWTYSFKLGTLAASQENISLGSDGNGALGVATVGATALVAISNGKPMATGATVYSFAAHDLSQVAAPSVRAGEFAATRPLATDGTAFVYATQLANKQVDVRFLGANATDASAPVTIVPSTSAASDVKIIRGGSAYAMVYATAGGKTSYLVLLDDTTLAPALGPRTFDSNPTYQAYRPTIGYAPASQTYLVAWHTKDVTGDDDVWAELFDAHLVAIGAPFEIAPFSQTPSIATDGSDFWMTYTTYDPAGLASDILAGSHVTSSGAATAYAITGSGGKPSQWTMIERAGQSVLVWTEINGSGPDLYISPMCN